MHQRLSAQSSANHPQRILSGRWARSTCWIFLCLVLFAPSIGWADTDRNLSSSGQLITVSLVPDGTMVGNTPSKLFSKVQVSVGRQRLMDLAPQAMQEWIRHTNLNFHILKDSGDPLGTRGLNRQDPRFGDVRIAAIPMPKDVRAVAFSLDNPVSGTWSGDIILNSNYPFDASAFVAVLAHEFGHSLGFEHSTSPKSIMYPSNSLSQLSTTDIAMLQQRYGVRNLDIEEQGSNNDTMEDASSLDIHGSDRGAYPALAFGDLPNGTDVDFWEFQPDKDLSGTVRFQARARGNSLVAMQLQLLDSRNKILAQASCRGINGIAQFDIDASNLPKKCYLRIQSNVRSFQTGSYAVLAFYPDRLTIPQDWIDEAASWNYSHFSQNDLREWFQLGKPDFFFADDLHTNDTLATATLLEPYVLQNGNELFRIDASIADAIDLDFYQLTVPEFETDTTLTLSIHSRDNGLLIPYVQVMTPAGFLVPSRVLANGNGLQVLQVDGVAPGTPLVLSVAGGLYSASDFQTGNYTLEARFDRLPIQLLPLAVGQLQPAGVNYHTVRVARSQMFHLGLEATSTTAETAPIVFASVYRNDGTLIYRIATRPAEFRSSQSILLSPGSYILRMEQAVPEGATGQTYDYRFLGLPDTESEGPVLIDPTASPFPNCDKNPDIYCYPDGKFSDPYIWIDGLSPDLNPPSDPPLGWDNVDPMYWPDMAIV